MYAISMMLVKEFRGKAGLSVINFEADPVQRQVEKITIGGNIADGDRFQLQLNELSSIGR